MIKIILFEIPEFPADSGAAFAFVGIAWAIAFMFRNGFSVEFSDPNPPEKSDERKTVQKLR